ncbi:aldehyde dehydrogenase family protein [Halopelagius fulvigenes]|uniref:Aldehyde dehydrogenase family protein n=1 Tax=Halopelagius fulvigenes TaxID=1198324 RepID=A0ABD5U2D3_9EURY
MTHSRRKEEATETLVREEGKTRSEASGEVQRAIDIFAYYAQKARDLSDLTTSPSSQNKDTYREQGDAGLDFSTSTKTIYRNY